MQAPLEEKFKTIKEKIGDEAFDKLKKGKLDVSNYTTMPEENYKSTKSALGTEEEDHQHVNIFKQGKKYLEVGMK